MSFEMWIATGVIALGTFLMRALPFALMMRKMSSKSGENLTEQMPLWLSILGPTMVAAMFGASLVPTHPSSATWIATVFGVLGTLLFWFWRRSMGLPVFAGVAIYGVVLYMLRFFF